MKGKFLCGAKKVFSFALGLVSVKADSVEGWLQTKYESPRN